MPQSSNSSLLVRIVRGLVLLAACGFAIFNGSLWSPVYDSISYILYLATRGWPFMSAARAADATPIVIAIMTLLLAGIPAALYERVRGLQVTSVVSATIWLVATFLLTLPTIINATGG